MEDTYVYVSVKLYLKHGQTNDSIQEIIQECDYSFVHDEIIEHEIVDILDSQIAEDKNRQDPHPATGCEIFKNANEIYVKSNTVDRMRGYQDALDLVRKDPLRGQRCMTKASLGEAAVDKLICDGFIVTSATFLSSFAILYSNRGVETDGWLISWRLPALSLAHESY